MDPPPRLGLTKSTAACTLTTLRSCNPTVAIEKAPVRGDNMIECLTLRPEKQYRFKFVALFARAAALKYSEILALHME